MKKNKIMFILLFAFSFIFNFNVVLAAPPYQTYTVDGHLVLDDYKECTSGENVGSYSNENGVTLYVKKAPEHKWYNFLSQAQVTNVLNCKNKSNRDVAIIARVYEGAQEFNLSDSNLTSNEGSDSKTNAEECYGIFGDLTDDGSKNGNGVPSTGYVIIKILNYIKFLGPILVIVFTILDLIKVVTSNDKDALLKFGKTTVKRVIYAVLLFVMPSLVNWFIKFAFAGGTCKIS